MASLKDTINQAISDFNGIEQAIEACGVDVPYGLDTSEYDTKVVEVYNKGLEDGKSVFNANTHYDFPSIGDVNIIYKAYEEKLIYQWNATQLKYEPLGSTVEVDIGDIEFINGGNASGTA